MKPLIIIALLVVSGCNAIPEKPICKIGDKMPDTLRYYVLSEGSSYGTNGKYVFPPYTYTVVNDTVICIWRETK